VRTPVRRLAFLAVLALVSPACGGTKKVCIAHGIKCENLPRHKVYDVNWTEHADVGPTKPIAVFRVRRIEVGPDGWKLTASFTNASRVTFRMPAGGASSPKDFGLGVFTTRLPERIEEPGNYLLKAETVTPPFPRELHAGQTWNGTMASSEPPRSSRWLRVLFGVFFWTGKPPYTGLGPYFVWQTSHTVQAPPPVGPTSSS
jgi:hypothetical protein